MDDLAASDVGDAVRIARALLLGEGGPKRDMLVLNAGAALLVAGAAGSLEEGRQLADRALSSGAALRTLDALVRISNEPAM
jgi:anthranilate phosphoribosyltransferase